MNDSESTVTNGRMLRTAMSKNGKPANHARVFAANRTFAIGQEVFTRFGKGRIVHFFPNSSVAVEFEHGGGSVLMHDDLFSARA